MTEISKDKQYIRFTLESIQATGLANAKREELMAMIHTSSPEAVEAARQNAISAYEAQLQAGINGVSYIVSQIKRGRQL